jgi:hypothetical protein
MTANLRQQIDHQLLRVWAGQVGFEIREDLPRLVGVDRQQRGGAFLVHLVVVDRQAPLDLVEDPRMVSSGLKTGKSPPSSRRRTSGSTTRATSCHRSSAVNSCNWASSVSVIGRGD